MSEKKTMSAKDVIYSAAALRGQRKFQEAIDIVESNLADVEDWAQTIALLQAFFAADEGGMTKKAQELARKLAAKEPGLPSIKRYLG